MHRLVPCLTALVCAAIVTGCGGDGEETAPGPSLPRGLVSELAAESDAIADAYDAGDVCSAAGQADELLDAVLAAIENGRVPPEFQESLTATANKLVNEINCPDPAAPPPEAEEDEEQQEEAPDCSDLEAEKEALEEERDETTGRGRERRLDEEIAALEEQIKECEEGGNGGEGDGDDEEGDD